MRVGLLIYGDLGARSGGYLYDRMLVSYLRSQGDTVEVIGLRQRPYGIALLHNTDARRLAEAGLDVLVQDELVHPAVIRSNRRLAALSDCPVVGLVHLLAAFSGRPGPVAWLYRLAESRYLQTLDGLILNSRTSLDQARRLTGGALPPHVVAVPAGDHLDGGDAGASPPAPANGPLRILYVGNVIRQKGLDILLRALATLPPTGHRLTVAGRLDMEPRYAGYIHRLIRRLGLAERVLIKGPVGQEGLPRLYRDHELFVMPSVNEAYGIVYLEAQRFGLPVIGTTAGGAAEIIEQGVNGYLIPPGDSGALAARLDSLYRDRQLLRSLGEAGRARYRQHPSWRDTGEAIRRFLGEVTAGRPQRHD